MNDKYLHSILQEFGTFSEILLDSSKSERYTLICKNNIKDNYSFYNIKANYLFYNIKANYSFYNIKRLQLYMGFYNIKANYSFYNIKI